VKLLLVELKQAVHWVDEHW
jgi:hypothetical protein